MFVVEIRLATSEASQAIFSFSSFPVRLGRNPQNEVHVDMGFVSEWHGVFEQTGRGMEYRDLGSTNGTEVGGARIPTNKAILVDGETTLTIGLLRLTIRHDIGPKDPDGAVPAPSPARPDPTAPPRAKTTPPQRDATQENVNAPPAVRKMVPTYSTEASSAPLQSKPAIDPLQEQRVALPASNAIKAQPRGFLPSPIPSVSAARELRNSPLPSPPYERENDKDIAGRGPPSLIMPKAAIPALRDAGRKPIAPPTIFGVEAPRAEMVAARVAANSDQPSPPAAPVARVAEPKIETEKAGIIHVPEQRLPPVAVAIAPPASPSVGKAAAPAASASALDRKSEAVAGGTRMGKLAPFQSGGNDDMERLLRALCQAALRLRDGYSQQASEMGIRIAKLDNPLFRATSGEEAARLLTTESANLIRSVASVTEFFDSLGMHNVALMHAFAEGARAVLHHIDPASPHNETSGRLFRRTDRTRLEATSERIANLSQNDEALMSVLFGPEFAAAYDLVIRNKKT